MIASVLCLCVFVCGSVCLCVRACACACGLYGGVRAIAYDCLWL